MISNTKISYPIPQDPIGENFRWRDWLQKLSDTVYGSMASQDSSDVTITGGSISNTTFDNITNILIRNHNDLQNFQGGTTDEYYHLTNAEHTTAQSLMTLDGYIQGDGAGNLSASTTIPWTDISNTPFIETVTTSAGPFALTTTPALLKPTTTNNANGISYDSTTGEYTFTAAGIYTLSLSLNVEATSANQKVIIYAENNTGSGWVVNTNSGKQVELINGAITQINFSLGTRRTAGQKVRYYIYATSTNVRLLTTTLGLTGAIVPAIRLIYTG